MISCKNPSCNLLGSNICDHVSHRIKIYDEHLKISLDFPKQKSTNERNLILPKSVKLQLCILL